MAKKLNYQNNTINKKPIQTMQDDANAYKTVTNNISYLKPKPINNKNIKVAILPLSGKHNNKRVISINNNTTKKVKDISAQERITIGLYGEIANNPKYKNYIRTGAANKLNNYARKYGKIAVSNIIKSAVRKKRLPFFPYVPVMDNKLLNIRKTTGQHNQKYRKLL